VSWKGLLKCIFTCVACLGCVSTFGTTVVLIRTPTEIYAAADSFGTVGNTELKMCKITQAGNIFFALAGMYAAPPFDFYPSTFAVKAAQMGGTVAESGAAFSRLTEAPFRKTIVKIKKRAPHLYKAEYVHKEEALVALFFGFDPDGQPAFDAEYFSLSRSVDGKIIVTPSHHSCPGNDCVGKLSLMIIGSADAALAAANKPGFLTKDDLANDAKKLVEVEIHARPESVRGPIDVLRVSKLSTDWAYPSQTGCPKIK
jgi:hypothetical protein